MRKKYLKTKLKTYSKVNTVFFSDNRIPKEKTHYSFIAAICIDFVLKLNEENYCQVYLEQCKYRQKKKKLIDFVDAELEDSSDDDDSQIFNPFQYVLIGISWYLTGNSM